MRKKQFKGFYDVLSEAVKDEKGIYEGVIKYCPSFFKLLCNILKDKRTDWHTRLVIDAALSYFVVPNDIIPEEDYGTLGYIDDVFLCAYVLNEIKTKVSEELLVDNWEGEGNILEIVDSVSSQSKKIVQNKYNEILEFVGLKKNRLPTLTVKEEYGTNDQLRYERMELIGLLTYVTRVLYELPPARYRDIERLKQFLKEQDTTGEIQRIVSELDAREKRVLSELQAGEKGGRKNGK